MSHSTPGSPAPSGNNSKARKEADTALWTAAAKGDLAGVKLAVEQGGNPNKWSKKFQGSALWLAAHSEREEIVDFLLPLCNATPEGSPDGLSLLRFACEKAWRPYFRSFADKLARQFAVQDSAVVADAWAWACGEVAAGADEFSGAADPAEATAASVVTLAPLALAGRGDEAREGWEAAAFCAVYLGEKEALASFLDGFDFINSRDTAQTTPMRNTPNRSLLTAAAFAGQADVFDLLVQRGCDPDEPDGSGVVPLSAAVSNGEPRIFGRFLAHAKDPNAKRAAPTRRPIWFAAGQEGGAASAQMLRQLMAAGADPRVESATGETPLFACVRTDFVEGARILAAVSDWEHRPTGGMMAGKTAMQVAMERGVSAMIDAVGASLPPEEVLSVFDAVLAATFPNMSAMARVAREARDLRAETDRRAPEEALGGDLRAVSGRERGKKQARRM